MLLGLKTNMELFLRVGLLGIAALMGGKLHPKLNTVHQTDSEQVP